MSFPKTDWATGDVWDAPEVNDLEQRTADAMPTITSQSITVGGTTADPTLELPASVLHGTMILPVPGTATTANALASGSGPWTESIAMPTVTVGDRAWLWVVAGSTADTPTGWTLKASSTTNDAKCFLFKRTINGTEGSTVSIVFQSQPNQIAAVIVPVPGVTDGETYGTVAAPGGAPSSLALSVLTPSDDCCVLYFQGSADASSETATPPVGFDEVADLNSQFGFRQASVGHKTAAVNADTTVNVTVSMTATAALAGVMIAIPSATYQAITKQEVLDTGLTATDLSALTAGPDGKLLPSQQQPGAFGVWRTLGDMGAGGWLTAIEYCPADPNRVLCGGDMLGVGLSTDSGDSWQATYGFSSWEIQSFTWHPTDSRQVWCGTMSGPYLSVDGGVNWVAKNTGMPTNDFPYGRPTQKVLYNPADPSELWAFFGNFRRYKSAPGGALNYGQIYHSTDGGTTWALQATIGAGLTGIDSAALSADQSTLMAVSVSNGLWRSADNGANWTQILSAAPYDRARWIEAHATVAGTWYLACEVPTSGTANLYTSTDNGDTWGLLGDNVGLASHGYRSMRVSQDAQTMWAVTDQSVYHSTNGGTNWTQYNPTLPSRGFSAAFGVANAALALHPTTSSFAMFGTSDEIFRTRDNGRTLDSASTKTLAGGAKTGRGFSGMLGVRIRFSRFVQGTVALNAYDAGNLMLSRDNGVTWSRPTASYDPYDGGYDTDIAGPTGQVMWVSLGQAAIFQGLGVSTNGGSTFTVRTGSGLPSRYTGTRNYNSICAISLSGLVALATINGSIYRTTDGGTSWAVVTGSAHAFQELLVDQTTLSVDGTTTKVYAAGYGGIYSSTNGGTTWAQAAGTPINGSCTYMKFDNPAAPTKIYLANWQPNSSQSANQGVWRYDIAGGTFARIFNDFNTRDVAINPLDTASIVVTTDDNPYHTVSYATGVYWSRDAGATWAKINQGLRMLRMWAIEFDPWHPGRVIAGANGGGFWVTNLPSGASAADERAVRLPVAQRAVKPGYGEKELGYPDLGVLIPGPLDSSFGATPRLHASQAPGSVPATQRSAAYTFALEDAGTVVESTAASAVTFTIPTNAAVAFPIGSYIEVFQYGAGQITVAGDVGVTLRSDNAASKTNAQYATMGLRKRATDEWVLSGDLTA